MVLCEVSVVGNTLYEIISSLKIISMEIDDTRKCPEFQENAR